MVAGSNKIFCYEIAAFAMFTLVGEANSQSDDIAAKTQNPISSMISLPFEFTFDNGAPNGDANILNIQPVIPISAGDWNLVNRLIIPVADAPGGITLASLPGVPGVPPIVDAGRVHGLGDTNYSLFFSPNNSGDWTWGVGPSVNIPTATNTNLGSGKWSVGPTAVILTQPAPWTIGALVRQVWSVAGDDSRPEVSQLALQPFVNYNLEDGWYLSSSPTLVANWHADEVWTVPVGLSLGRIFKIGEQPVNLRFGGEYNVVRPESAPEWALKFTFQFLFPKG
ncbi:MAG: transporter [Rhizobiaceae bacterium]